MGPGRGPKFPAARTLGGAGNGRLAMKGRGDDLYMGGRGAATTADEHSAGLGVFLGIASEVGRIGAVLEATFAEARRTGVGLGGQRQWGVASKLLEHLEQALRSQG